jgi:acetamidase/formamidase
MTGPFFVKGAEPGDTLIVHIDRMTPNRDTGWTFTPLAPNVVDPGAAAKLFERRQCFWNIDRQAGTARLADPPASLRDWSVALSPMIGCFGVAPASGQAISTATSGPYGGNMDYRRFGPGATAYFPVAVSGALFFLGDGHACQGDGEIVGTGIETSFEIEFTVRLAKGKTIAWPRGETAEYIFTIGNARPLDQALQHATTEMLAWLASDYGLDLAAASHLLGQAVRYDVANVFNPAYSVACRLSKRWLDGRAALE